MQINLISICQSKNYFTIHKINNLFQAQSFKSKSNTQKILPLDRGEGFDVVLLPMNCKITQKLVPIDLRFKNRRLSNVSQKRSRENLEICFALVRPIQMKKQFVQFSQDPRSQRVAHLIWLWLFGCSTVVLVVVFSVVFVYRQYIYLRRDIVCLPLFVKV